MIVEKLKGIVREPTLARILDDAVSRSYADGRIYYYTRKSSFVAERKNTKYWRIFQLTGTVE